MGGLQNATTDQEYLFALLEGIDMLKKYKNWKNNRDEMNQQIIELVIQIPSTNALSQLIRKSFRQTYSTKTKYSLEAYR